MKKNDIMQLIRENGGDILYSDNHRMSEKHIQHGTMSVRKHTINVAIYSIVISEKLGLKCSKKDLIRGALLHDYFLYDWHIKGNSHHNLHGFYHPGIALNNASKEYQLTKKQKDIIKKHMWPLTIIPPMCLEAWIVSMADKYCSLLETFRILNGKKTKKKHCKKYKLKCDVHCSAKDKS